MSEVVCDTCEKEFKIKMKEKSFYVDKQRYKATYFKCPHCGRTHTLCIDNLRTMSLKALNAHKGIKLIRPTMEMKKEYESINRIMEINGIDKSQIDKY